MLKKDTSNYDASSIKELPYPDCVRLRKEMYIGGGDKEGQLTCIREIFNNSIDECLAGYATEITVTKHGDFIYSVVDNGRGVPHTLDKDSNKSIINKIFGTLHSGRNFEGRSEFYRSGLNGVGASCVNALSDIFGVTSIRDGEEVNVTFSKGLFVEESRKKSKSKNTSTEVIFQFDSEIYKEEVPFNEVEDMVAKYAYLAPVKVNLVDETSSKVYKKSYNIENGLQDYLPVVLGNRKSILKNPIHVKQLINDTLIEVAFTYCNDFKSESITSFVNTINTSLGGTHVTGFKRALSSVLVNHINDNKLSKEVITSDDILDGLTCLVSVFSFEPKFDSQTKQKLENNEVNGYVYKLVNSYLKEWIVANPSEMKNLAILFNTAAKARIAKKKAVDGVYKAASKNSSLFSSLSSIGKFKDCHTDDPSKGFLYISEGESAGGTFSKARDKETQALYTIKGKIVNVVDKTLDKATANKEIEDIFNILRCGTGSNYDESKLKFKNIVFLADADNDGSHINLLLLSLFNEFFKPLIEKGYVYLAVPPLYRLLDKQGKATYVENDDALSELFSKEITNSLKFKRNGKLVKDPSSIIQALRKYSLDIINYTDNAIDPEIFEELLVLNCMGDISNLSDSISLVDINNTNSSISGFFTRNDNSEEFISYINFNKVETMNFAKDKFEFIIKLFDNLEVFDKNDKPVEINGFISLYKMIEKSVTNKYRITYFKG